MLNKLGSYFNDKDRFLTASTKMNYIRHILEFLRYCVYIRRKDSGFTDDMLKEFVYRKDNWKGFLTKQDHQETQSRLLRDVEQMLTPKDFQDYLKKPRVLETIKILKNEYDLPQIVKRTLHTAVRNHLITVLVMLNASRPMGISEITIEQFERRSYHKKTKTSTIVVSIFICLLSIFPILKLSIFPILKLSIFPILKLSIFPILKLLISPI